MPELTPDQQLSASLKAVLDTAFAADPALRELAHKIARRSMRSRLEPIVWLDMTAGPALDEPYGDSPVGSTVKV